MFTPDNAAKLMLPWTQGSWPVVILVLMARKPRTDLGDDRFKGLPCESCAELAESRRSVFGVLIVGFAMLCDILSSYDLGSSKAM